MQELLVQVLTYLRAMWRHRWPAMGVAWLVAVIGTTVVFKMPDKYEASARIYVDTQTILQPLLSGLTVRPNVEQSIAMLSRTLISRPNVEKLVRMADLDLKLSSKADQEALVDGLMKTLEIKGTTSDNLYTLAYRDSDPARAEKVVQSLVSIFVESSLGDKRKDTESAKQFIDEQISEYEKKLTEAEDRLKQFKLRNLDYQAGGSVDSLGQMGELSVLLNQSRLALREAEFSRDALRRQIAGEDPVLLPDYGNEASQLPEVDGRIDALKRNLDALLQRYTEDHPDVVGTRRVIKDLEEQKRKELDARKKLTAGQPARSVNSNPVYQQLRVSLAEAEANVASLQARVGEYSSRLGRLQSTMRNQPEIEAEYAQLNRDYDIIKSSYTALVSRRESANLSGDLEARGSGANFRLIDPPRVSPQPVAPNRMLLLLASLLVTLVAGVAAAFVISQLRPVVFTGRNLRELTGLPLLGTVTRIKTAAETQQEKRSLHKFLLTLASLLLAYAAGFGMLFMLARNAVAG